MTLVMISQANPIVILTKCFEEVWRGKLPVEENGAVVDVESPAHADKQDLQAAYRVKAKTWKWIEMEEEITNNLVSNSKLHFCFLVGLGLKGCVI